MKITKPQDSKAAEIEFGVEIETQIPLNCGILVGHYHNGRPLVSAYAPNRELLNAPVFNGQYWKTERDGSITCDAGYQPCEFVSPILKGEAGILALCHFLEFARAIGAKVNRSCGCHVTVGIRSVTGSDDPASISRFVQKLAVLANHNAWAIYAQTGTDRHNNGYSHTLRDHTPEVVAQMQRTTDTVALQTLAARLGRGMVNFNKAFRIGCHAIEFRAFAGTLNTGKVLHHVATALGLMRRAHTMQVFGAFKKSEKKCRTKTAREALRRMWRILGWFDSVPNRDCALGLFGPLHADFAVARKAALKMADQFEKRFPAANL